PIAHERLRYACGHADVCKAKPQVPIGQWLEFGVEKTSAPQCVFRHHHTRTSTWDHIVLRQLLDQLARRQGRGTPSDVMMHVEVHVPDVCPGRSARAQCAELQCQFGWCPQVVIIEECHPVGARL